ncbi:MAG: hypothetical protein R3A80_10260 [Bdellovibrionota bacterium]
MNNYISLFFSFLIVHGPLIADDVEIIQKYSCDVISIIEAPRGLELVVEKLVHTSKKSDTTLNKSTELTIRTQWGDIGELKTFRSKERVNSNIDALLAPGSGRVHIPDQELFADSTFYSDLNIEQSYNPKATLRPTYKEAEIILTLQTLIVKNGAISSQIMQGAQKATWSLSTEKSFRLRCHELH